MKKVYKLLCCLNLVWSLTVSKEQVKFGEDWQAFEYTYSGDVALVLFKESVNL